MTARTTKDSLEHGASLPVSTESACERVFRLPEKSLLSRYRGNRHRIPCRNLIIEQSFVVDDVGVYWVDHHRQEQTFGGDHHIVPLDQSGDDEDAWTRFLDAAHATRVFAAIVRLRRVDLRTALWLSRKARNGEYRFLQFAENHAEIVTQILPHHDEGERWRTRAFQKAWKLVARNAKPRRVARFTVLGPAFASAPGVRSSDVYSGILARDLLARARHDVFCAWNALAPAHLKDTLWRNPRLIVETVCREASPSNWGSPQWLPTSLILRSILNSGLGAVARARTLVPHPLDGMPDAANDLLARVFVPQLFMSGYDGDFHGAATLAATLAKQWLMLRFGTPAERRETAERMPDAAREAEKRRGKAPNWADFRRWNAAHHQAGRLARGLFVAMGGDSREPPEGRLGTPLVLDAGGGLGEGIRRIGSAFELAVLSRDEAHCIASFEYDLRRGKYHCLVIEDELGRSTVLVEERVLWERREGTVGLVLQKRDPYRVSECRMRRNRPSPVSHHERAQQIVDRWCALAASQGAIRAGTQEVRIRSAARTATPEVTPAQVHRYWDEVSRDSLPHWLLDFDPANGLIDKLFEEHVRRREGPDAEVIGG